MLFFTGHFGYWEIQAIAFALHAEPISVLARPLDNPCCTRCSSGSARAPATGHLPARRSQTVLRELQSNRGVAMLIDQHLHSDAVYGGLLRASRGDDVGAGGAGAAHRRAGDSGVRAAAAGRPLSLDLRVSRAGSRDERPDAIREFTQRCTDVLEMYVRRHPDLWLWMHRRWRDQEPAPAEQAS